MTTLTGGTGETLRGVEHDRKNDLDRDVYGLCTGERCE